jgi:phosphopantothenoylcysteine decarboxylase/phosphopantothenate--cysteine ligase
MNLQGKTIILGISGGIAACKSVDLASLLKKQGANVVAVCTEKALNFVSELSLQVITGNKVYLKQYEIGSPEIDHIKLADEADLILIAPATANTIAKLAAGIADNLLLDICLASTTPVMLAPAMNTKMWEHKTTVRNLKFLQEELNYQVINPAYGELACGHVGEGRLADLECIVKKVCDFSEVLPSRHGTSALGLDQGLADKDSQCLKNRKIVITAGGTRESIDPVRFIGNHSSGLMGLELAKAAQTLGAEVCLITTGLTFHKTSALGQDQSIYEQVSEAPKSRIIRVETAEEMKAAVEIEFKDADALIMAAAVADYKPREISSSKIKKNTGSLVLELEKTPDILETIAKTKKPNQVLIGFALETENLIENAAQKLKEKNLDLIIANSSEALGSVNSTVTLISSKPLPKVFSDESNIHNISKQAKFATAKLICDCLIELFA